MLEKIALQKKLISRDDYLKTVSACRGTKNYEEAVKQYFLDNHLLGEEKIRQLSQTVKNIQILKSSIKYGQAALNFGMIDADTLSGLLARQKKTMAENQEPRFIGQMLLDSGKLTRDQIITINQYLKTGPATAGPTADSAAAPAEEEPAAPPAHESFSPKNAGQTSPVSETLSCGLLLEIENNGMAAFLTKTEQFDDTITADDIYDLLASRSIQSGLAKEELVQGFITSSAFKTNRFKAASGIEMIQGKDARIIYHFDTDYLKAGDMGKEGRIDFRERGKIPKVEQGTLLAEKFPKIESRNGRNIYGQELTAEPARNLELKTQTGAVLSDDGLKLYAAISGYPRLEWSGAINVFATFLVRADVGYQTGHIVYDGDIEIKGGIKAGFKVSGRNVKVMEIDGGQVAATGDVRISNGANNARIHAKGHVKAKFFHDSFISCLGHLVAEKEIVDSTAVISGALKMENGEIINSEIAANRGVFVKNLGTEKTQPNIIKTGQDMFAARELARISEQENGITSEKEKLEKKQDSLKAENQRLKKTSASLANELEKARFEGIELMHALAQPDHGDRKNLNSQMKRNNIYFSRLNRELAENDNRIAENARRIEQTARSCGEMVKTLEDLAFEKEILAEWMSVNPPDPVVTVTGDVFSGTLIYGRHSKTEVKEVRRRVSFKEICATQDGTMDRNAYEIVIYDRF